MNVLLALTAFLVFLVAPSLGDGNQCTGVNSFTAITFDNIRFKSTRSYHAVLENLTRYVNLDDNGMTLWDFNKGNIWVMNDDGSCIQYNSDDLALGSDLATNVTITPMPLTSDGYGKFQTGNSFKSGNLEVRNRVTPYPDCTGTFIDLWVDGEQRWSETYQDARRPLTDEEIQANKDARTMFEAADCIIEEL